MPDPNAQPLRVLILDDLEADAELVLRELRRSGFDPTWKRAENEDEYLEGLAWQPQIILADFSMPSFTASRALQLRNARGLDTPFIVISGSITEETAVEILKNGAADYLLKDRLARTGPAVRRALDERSQRMATIAITRRLRESEARTRFALEASHVGVWEADLDTGAATWSEILEALHGLAPGTFGGSLKSFLEHVHPEDRGQVAQTIERATRERTDSNILYRTTWPDGSVHWISGIGRTFYDDQGRPRRAAGIGLDVTDHRSLEEQYRQAHKMEAVGQLAGGVAHDFNNLLTVIGGFCALMAEEAGPENEFEPFIKEIQKAADRANSLTRQLLAFGRRQILEVTVFDLREAILGMETMLRRLIGEHIDIRMTTSSEECRVRADRAQIEQVVLNLAINARDAMPSGGVLLFEITCAVLDESYARQHPGARTGRYALMAVSDTGSGMSPDVMARIFEPFFTTKTRGKGTGLGLSTVYGIVKQSGGNIYVYSEPGRGTTFKVYLPLVESQVDSETVAPVTAVGGGSETILVVEDDESVREFIKSVLVPRGFRVLIASRPTIALEMAAAEAGPIDLLVSDVVLPEMSGKALATALLESRPGLKVLYMSGYTDDAIVSQGVLEPGTNFLSKPFMPAALLRKVREILTPAAPPG